MLPIACNTFMTIMVCIQISFQNATDLVLSDARGNGHTHTEAKLCPIVTAIGCEVRLACHPDLLQHILARGL
jgi:hypothetical protein